MGDCCSNSACEIEKLRERQYGTLKIVLLINAVMFVVELTAGLMASSTALLADSLDMLGDAFVYGFSLYVVAKSDAWKAVSAMVKGVVMALFGFFVMGQVVYKLMVPVTPIYETIGIIGFIALLANLFCLLLLWKHKTEDVNMSSVWLCSRNDIIANVSVLCAGAGVWLTQDQWPDIVVGIAIALLFLRSSYYVLSEAVKVKAAANAIPVSD